MKKIPVRHLVLLALLVAVQMVLASVNIPMPGGLSITFNMIPMAIAAIALGPWGGAAVGGAFGTISFLQCFGIFGSSAMGMILAGIDPFLAFVQRFFPRLIDGALLGVIFRFLESRAKTAPACAVTGFFAAFLNTLLFMTSLVWIFGGTEYMRDTMAGRGMFAYITAAVGVNGIVEMVVSTAVTGAVGTALIRAGLIRRNGGKSRMEEV